MRPRYIGLSYFERDLNPPGVKTKVIYINSLDRIGRNYLNKRIKKSCKQIVKSYDLFLKIQLFFFHTPIEEDAYERINYRDLIAVVTFPDPLFNHHLKSVKKEFKDELNDIPYYIQEKGFKITIFRKPKLISLEEECFMVAYSSTGTESLPPGLVRVLNSKYDSRFYV